MEWVCGLFYDCGISYCFLHPDGPDFRRCRAVSGFNAGSFGIIIYQHNDPYATYLRAADETYWFGTPPCWRMIFDQQFCHLNSRIVLMPRTQDEVNRVMSDLFTSCEQVRCITFLRRFTIACRFEGKKNFYKEAVITRYVTCEEKGKVWDFLMNNPYFYSYQLILLNLIRQTLYSFIPLWERKEKKTKGTVFAGGWSFDWL